MEMTFRISIRAPRELTSEEKGSLANVVAERIVAGSSEISLDGFDVELVGIVVTEEVLLDSIPVVVPDPQGGDDLPF